MKKSVKINPQKQDLQYTISRLNSIQQICKNEAEKNPLKNDLFQSGKQQAYSHIYYEINPILKQAKWIETDRLFYKFVIGGMAFCLGFLLCMWIFGLTNGLTK